MKDGIIKADGTSRFARSVADFKTKYPTYDAFATALVTGSLPLDILFNEAGWSQLPDFLNQANLLKVATAALYGKDPTAVPDDIFALIPGLLGEKLRMDLLWENASPTSSFAAQTVSVDLNGYDMVAVQVYSPQRASRDAVVPAGGNLFLFSLSGTGALHLNGFYFDHAPYYSGMAGTLGAFDRSASVTGAGLSFSECSLCQHSDSDSTGGIDIGNMILLTDNQYGVPTHIYGIKGVQA